MALRNPRPRSVVSLGASGFRLAHNRSTARWSAPAYDGWGFFVGGTNRSHAHADEFMSYDADGFVQPNERGDTRSTQEQVRAAQASPHIQGEGQAASPYVGSCQVGFDARSSALALLDLYRKHDILTM